MSKQPSVNEKSLMHEDSFDDDEEKGAVGTCRALYQLEGLLTICYMKILF